MLVVCFRLSVFGLNNLGEDRIGFLHGVTAPPPSHPSLSSLPSLPSCRIFLTGGNRGNGGKVVGFRLSVFGLNNLGEDRIGFLHGETAPGGGCRFSVVRFRFKQSRRRQDWISPWSDGAPAVPHKPTLPSLPYLLSDFLTGGNRGNGGKVVGFRLSVFGLNNLGEHRIGFLHGDTAPPPSHTNLPSVSLPSLLSDFLQEGTEATEGRLSVFGCPFSV